MSKKELFRHPIIQKLIQRELEEKEAARLIGLGVRQTRRLKKKVAEKGPQGLIHGNRGQTSHNRVPAPERQNIVNILFKHYSDFHPTHAQEKLRDVHGLNRDPKTIRQIMIQEGLWKPRRKKNQSEHREWRQRKAHFGELVQFDGSYEYWFEDRGPKGCLLLAVDDATGALVHGRFDEDEGVFPVFKFWQEYILKNGKPFSVYHDRFSTYEMTQKVAMENHDTLTQFQRAMEKLGIGNITAYSPEAKGRVETRFHTLQDRLIKEMRLKNVSDMEEANRYLLEEFLPWFNARYAVEPLAGTDLHQPLSDQERKRLAGVFSRQMERKVQNDFTVSYDNQWYQLVKGQPVTVCKRDTLIVEEYADGSVKLRLRGKYLNFQPISKGFKYCKKSVPWVLPAGPADNLAIYKKPVPMGHFNFPD